MTERPHLTVVPDPAPEDPARLRVPLTLAEGAPRAVVDALGQGWAIYGDDDAHGTPRLYFAHNDPERSLAPMPLDRLTRERGPVRPVSTNVSAQSVDYLTGALRDAGPKAALSVAAAITEAVRECDRRAIPAPTTILVSASESSTAAVLLALIADWGRDHAVAPRRLRHSSVEKIVDTLVSWATHPMTAFDVPAVLAQCFAAHADAVGLGLGLIAGHPPHNRALWRAVADQYLQPSAVYREGPDRLYHFLMSESDYYDADLFTDAVQIPANTVTLNEGSTP